MNYEAKKITMLLFSSIALIACGKAENTAGVVIDTSTYTAKVQGRSVDNLEGEWMRIYMESDLVDSTLIKEGGDLEVIHEENQSLKLETDSLFYFAYRIIQTDTIRPSAPLRFFFPLHEAWDINNPPEIIGWDTKLNWNLTHNVWTTDSLPAGRHLIRWSDNNETFQADLIVNEMANRFENHQFTEPIQAGSLRPKDCGFAPFQNNLKQDVGLGCPHTESDAFNRLGVSSADLFEWNDSLLRFQLVTLSNDELTKNPYSKLLLEFGPNEETFDLSSFDSLSITMNLMDGDTIAVRLAQAEFNVGHWFYKDIGGEGLKNYTIPLDTSLSALNKDDTLDLSKIFGLEFRNYKSGRAVLCNLHSIKFK